VENISLVGDFSLISHLIDLIYKQSKTIVNRWGILKTLNTSEEFSKIKKGEKSQALEELIRMQKLSVAQMKLA